MKRIFVLMYCIIGMTLSHAQSNYFAVEETTSFKDVKGASPVSGMFQLDNGETVIVRSFKKEVLVSVFDANYNVIRNIEFEIAKKESLLGTAVNGNNVFIFTSDKTDKKNVDVYAATYKSGQSSIIKKKLFSEVTGKRKGDSWLSAYTFLEAKRYNENFRVSPNGEYVAFALSNIKDKKFNASVRVFDNEYNEVYQKKYIDNIESFFQFDDFVVTDDAEIIIAGKEYLKGWADKKNKKANYEYVLHKISQNSKEKSTIDLGEHFVKQIRFSQYKNEIKMLGFYSDRNSDLMKGGISYTIKGQNINDIKVTTSVFPEQVFQDLYPKGKAERSKNKEKELRTFELDYILTDTEGNSYLTAEQFYITTVTTSNGAAGFVTTTVPNYDDILIVKFNPQGKIVWGRSIFKKANGPSYQPIEVDGQLHVFLNTGKNIANKSNDRKKLKKSFLEKSALYDIVYDANGKETYELIRENGGRKEFFSPWRGSYDLGTFVMPNFSKNKKQFLVLKAK